MNAVLKFVGQKASVHVNVDLSKKNIEGKPLLELFVNDADGLYRTQFETGTSGGSTNLVRRRGWERRMFGDVYDNKDTERPVYGNLNLVPHRSGDRSARQYGGSYMVLKEPVRKRCTITSRDSSIERAVLGTLGHFAHGLVDTVGRCSSDAQKNKLLQLLDYAALRPGDRTFPAIDPRLLPTYQEVQIHGRLDFARDVQFVIVCDADITERTRPLLTQFKERYGVPSYRLTSDGFITL